jgi:hypothetical protein
MTPLPRKRCDNERICYLYKNAMVGKKRKGPCNISPCISDTRSRPAPSPFATENLTVGMVAAYEQGLNNGKAQAREDVLLTLIERIDERKIEKWGESERDAIFRSIESLRTQEQPKND